jgi:tetratricopeptide (TPR) repeat protein
MRRDTIISLLLVAVTVCIYWSVGTHDFTHYDDPDYVTENPHVQAGLTASGIVWAFSKTVSEEGTYWHPVTWLSHMLDCEIFGLRPGPQHLMNLAFHAANVVLLYFVLLRLTGSPLRSAMVAALFALHPLQVDTVAWIAERKNVLSTLFWLLTTLAYVRYARKPDTRRYALVFVLYALGLMSKPMLVTVPCVLLLLDYWPLRRVQAKWAIPQTAGASAPEFVAATPGRLIIEKLPLFALALISGIITIIGHQRIGLLATTEQLPLSGRFISSLVSYAAYLKKAVWPADLAVFYPLPKHWPVQEIVGAAVVLAIVTILALKFLRQKPFLAVGWFWFLGTLVPVIGILQVSDQAMADRWAYVPLIGMFVVVVWAASDLLSGRPYAKQVLSVSAAAVLITLAVVTHRQLGYWQDTKTLFQHALAVTTNNAVAHNGLGDELYHEGKYKESEAEFLEALRIAPNSLRSLSGLGVLYFHEGNTDKAMSYFNTVLQKNPHYSDAHYELGNIFASQGKYAEAADQYAAAIRSRPDLADAHNNLGAMLLRLGRQSEAMDEFKTALRLRPNFPEAHVQLGRLLASMGRRDAARLEFEEAVRLKPDFVFARIQLGLILGQSGEINAAVVQFLDAIKYDPTNATAFYNLGAAYAAEKRLDLAADNFARAARLDPNDADTQGRLAAVLAVQGKSAEAARAYREALRLKPDWPNALRDLAWLLATDPKPEIRNGEDAVKFAEHANALAPKPDARFLEALDVAYAEAGRFDDAIKTAEKVQQLATAAKQTNVADRATQRIALYKAGKPYHQAAP